MYVYIIHIIMNFILRIFVAIGLFLVSPIILISIFIILCEDGLPVVFIQRRYGKKMKVFNLIKIRTMYKTAPNLGTHEVENSYYLKFGSILRKFKIDELPQLLNVVKGDLDLIGPRPGLPNQLELRKAREEYNIFSVNPGITGLSQVLGFDMSNPKILAKLDSIYISNKNFKLDILIFLATFSSIFRKKLEKQFNDEIKLLK